MPNVSQLDEHFPRYEAFSPAVAVWCVTPRVGRAIHRFFDTCPISPSGRYLAVLRLPQEERQPLPGEAAEVCVIDLETGEDRTVARSRGWEPQMGANLGWGSDDHALFFNDVEPGEWKPFAWKLDPVTGEKARLEGTIYQCSHDGRCLVSANMAAMQRTQYGYGAVVPDDKLPRNLGVSDEDGFFLTDTASGKRRRLISLMELVGRACPDPVLRDGGNLEVYGFHSKWNPSDDRLILTMRWFDRTDRPITNVMSSPHRPSLRFAVFTIKPDGGDLHLAVGPGQWKKGGHHINWCPDGRTLSMNLNIDGEGLRLVRCDYDGKNLGKFHPILPGSGHPTVHPDGRHILTDTYTREATAFGDGTVPLRWIDYRRGSEKCLARINTAQPVEETVMRVDPHPAWDRTWRWVTFNGYVGSTRRVFVADMSSVAG